MTQRTRPVTIIRVRDGRQGEATVYRRWPFDTLGVYERWTGVLSAKEAQAARNSAYLHARKTGKKFETARFPISERKVELHVERIQ